MSKTSVAIESIYGFAPEQANVQPSKEPIFVVTGSQLQEIIRQVTEPLITRIESLEDRTTSYDEKITSLESTELQDMKTLSHDISDAFTAIDELDRKIARSGFPTAPRGKKTLARINKIDEILKARGSTTLKELERILKIRPQEMSRIVARLDKRHYEIFLRDGNEREKVLKLKAQIS